MGHYNTGGGCVIVETDDVGVTWTSVDGLLWREMPEEGWKAREVQVVSQNGGTLIGLGVDYKRFDTDKNSGLAWTFGLPSSASDQGSPPPPTPEPTPDEGCGGP